MKQQLLLQSRSILILIIIIIEAQQDKNKVKTVFNTLKQPTGKNLDGEYFVLDIPDTNLGHYYLITNSVHSAVSNRDQLKRFSYIHFGLFLLDFFFVLIGSGKSTV